MNDDAPDGSDEARDVARSRGRKRLVVRHFTPSYETLAPLEKGGKRRPIATREAYEEAVRAGGKRFLHVQVASGRGPGRGRPPGDMDEKSAKRLAQQLPPWDRRTQSAGTPVTERTALPDLARRIQRGLDAYRRTQPGGALGLLVPDTRGVLIDAGVPPRAAQILVDRARRKFFLAAVPRVDETLLSAFTRALGFPVVKYTGTQVGIEAPKRGKIVRMTLTIPPLTGGGERTSMLVNEAQILESRKRWVAQAERAGIKYVADDADPAWVQQVFGTLDAKLREELQANGASTCTISVYLDRADRGSPGVKPSIVREVVQVPFGSTPSSGALLRGGYRTLENVGMDQLPAVLARLSRRKSRATSSALENPMSFDEQFWLDQYDNGPFGGSALVPSARRNMAGRPGRAGLPRTKIVEWAEGVDRKGFANRSEAMMKLGAKQLEAIVKKGGPQAKSAAFELRIRAENRAMRAPVHAAKKGKAKKPKRAKTSKTQKAVANRSKARRNTDETLVYQALVPARYPYEQDETLVRTALQNRRRAKRNSGLDNPGALWMDYWDPNYENALGQFGVGEEFTSGIQPMSRRNRSKAKRNSAMPPRDPRTGRFKKTKSRR